MWRAYRSLDEARRAFDEYAQIEPRLTALWNLCTRATPPVPRPMVDDIYDDPYDVDVIADGNPNDGWCVEDFFLEHVKSKLLLLAGMQRTGPAHALQSSDAYDALYDLLLNWALSRPCACCAEPDDDPSHRPADVPAQR